MNNNRARSLRQVRSSRSKRGVSPVIGVILMVAATIVIAGVVMGMLGGFKAPTVAPTVQLSAEASADNTIKFTHVGGDRVPIADMTVAVTNTTTGGGYQGGLTLKEATGDGDGAFEPGEIFTITTSIAGKTTFTKGTGHRFDITIIHVPTGKTMWGGSVIV